MTRFIFVACLCGAALAGCGRTLVRETVVERPVVQREAVIERPAVVSPAIVAAPAPSCGLGMAAYSSGTLSCQSGNQYQCINGAWERIANSTC